MKLLPRRPVPSSGPHYIGVRTYIQQTPTAVSSLRMPTQSRLIHRLAQPKLATAEILPMNIHASRSITRVARHLSAFLFAALNPLAKGVSQLQKHNFAW